MRRVLQVYQKLNPDKFVHNAIPVTIGFQASNDPLGEECCFNAPLNITASKYLDKFYNKKDEYLDLSQLVIGAKPQTFRMYKNYIAPTSKIITNGFVKKHPHLFTKEQILLFDDLFTMRKTIAEFMYTYRYIGWTWNAYSKYYKKHYTFSFPDDLEKYLNHYKSFKHMIEGYKIRKKE